MNRKQAADARAHRAMNFYLIEAMDQGSSLQDQYSLTAEGRRCAWERMGKLATDLDRRAAQGITGAFIRITTIKDGHKQTTFAMWPTQPEWAKARAVWQAKEDAWAAREAQFAAENAA